MHHRIFSGYSFIPLITAILLIFTACRVSVAGLVFPIDDASFDEKIIGPFDAITGAELGVAETVNDSGSKTIEPVTFAWKAQASADGKGPRATASMELSSEIQEPGGPLSVDAIAVSLISYSVAVINETGTLAPETVPLRFTGYYAISNSFSGEVRIARGGVSLSAFRTDSGVGSVLVSAVVSEQNPSPPVSAAFDEVFQVEVGAAPLDSVMLDIRLLANARASVAAWESFNMEVFEGTAKVDSFINPEIFIDPMWPQADKFSLVFSANIEPFAAPVPLPATIGLLSLGLTGLASRKRGRTPVIQAVVIARVGMD